MKAYSLFSGSSGNCFFVTSEGNNILIDCGVSARAAETALRSLGYRLDDINSIFVTHEHSDHTKGLEIISKYHHIPTHMTEISARALINDPACSLLHDLCLYPESFSVEVGALKVTSFRTPHDSKCSVGYIVEDKNGCRIGFATDMGCVCESVTDALSGCRAAVVEANHDVTMLMLGGYPYQLKRRILASTGHLSNEDCGTLCGTLAAKGTKSLLLAHISKENNTSSLALSAVRAALSDFPETLVAAASPCEITELPIL